MYIRATGTLVNNSSSAHQHRSFTTTFTTILPSLLYHPIVQYALLLRALTTRLRLKTPPLLLPLAPLLLSKQRGASVPSLRLVILPSGGTGTRLRTTSLPLLQPLPLLLLPPLRLPPTLLLPTLHHLRAPRLTGPTPTLSPQTPPALLRSRSAPTGRSTCSRVRPAW